MEVYSRMSTLFIGLGGVGCKVVEKLHKERLQCIFVDCDIDALDALEVSADCKYAIKNGCKTEGDRQQGKKYIGDMRYELNELMLYVNANAHYVYLVFGMGGGFGGAVAPILASEYGKRFNPERNEKSNRLGDCRYFGVIPIVPPLEKNQLQGMNAVQCYNELFLLQEIVKNYMFLDNRSNEIESVAKAFQQIMCRFLSGSQMDRRGIISRDEIGFMMQKTGIVFMGELEKKDGKYRIKDNGVFMTVNGTLCIEYGCVIGTDIQEIKPRELDEICISTQNTFYGYSTCKETYIYIVGKKMPDVLRCK